MSDQGRARRDLPRRPRDLDHLYAAEEEDRERRRERPAAMATSTITLPPIQDQYGSYSSSAARGGYHPDPRASNSYGTSPSSVNGYGPPSNQPPYLPPLQPPGDPRSPTYPPPPREDYYRQPPPPPPGGQYPDPYYAGYNRGPPPPPPGYGNPGPYGPHHYEYGPRGPGGPPPMPQATPRQRTSIACKYCRKRKIRCSGYQSAPGGKCVNCSRMGMECIFQPVSSSSSTAFIPVSALSNGVIPPGTQLFGAYGQPLPPAQQPYQPGSSYPPPLQSPTTPYPPYDSQDMNNGAGRGRRRPRRSDEPDDIRLPPPNPSHPDDPMRRSPADGSSHGSPPSHYYGPPGGYEAHRGGPTHSPGGASTGPAPSPLSRGSTGYSYGGGEGTTPPPGRGGANPQAASGSSNSVMNLSNLVETSSDIDRSMLGKLDRRNQK